jgi:uncharacterized membrane protein
MPNDQLDGAPESVISAMPQEKVVSTPEKSVSALEPELLEKIEEAARFASVMTVKHEMHSGPMPAPKQFADYEAILPGTAKVIRDEFQANGAHVREMEKEAMSAQIANDKENRATAERLVWASLIATVIVALLGHNAVAIAIAGTTVTCIIAGFVAGKKVSINKTEKSNSSEEV